jgi:hypothetical protein
VGNAPIGLLATQLLGELKSRAALPYFRALPNTENDFYLLREVLTALTKARVTEGRAVLCEATNYESRIVGDFARTVMDSGKP